MLEHAVGIFTETISDAAAQPPSPRKRSETVGTGHIMAVDDEIASEGPGDTRLPRIGDDADHLAAGRLGQLGRVDTEPPVAPQMSTRSPSFTRAPRSLISIRYAVIRHRVLQAASSHVR